MMEADFVFSKGILWKDPTVLERGPHCFCRGIPVKLLSCSNGSIGQVRHSRAGEIKLGLQNDRIGFDMAQSFANIP